jgi:hypothetical protein
MTALRVIGVLLGILLGGLGLLTSVATIDGGGGPFSVGLVLGVVLLFLGSTLVYAAARAGSGRRCPHCGKSVKNGLVICPTCGFDFKTRASFGLAQLAPLQGPQPPEQS